MESPVLKRLFTVDEFHQMGEGGVFGEDDRLELLDGEIVQVTPIGKAHAACVDRENDRLWERCHTSAIVREVADTTGNHDRRVKVPSFVRAGVPEVWVVDLNARMIDVYARPVAGEYRDQRRVGPGESLAIPGVPGQQLAVGDILA